MGDAFWDIAVNLIAVFIVFVGRLLGFDFYTRMVRVFRLCRVLGRRLAGRSTILLHTDCDDELHTSRALASTLEKAIRDGGGNVKVEIVRNGVDFGRSSFSSKGVLAILVLLTDVTQLSADHRDRRRIQKRMVRYVHKGGRLLLGHDVIYRRSKNEYLQRLAGCVLDGFRRTNERVGYVRVESGMRATANAALLEELPPSLTLGDNEIILGEWNDDVEYLYTWDRDKEAPLVTRRTVGKGRVFWLNSGDSSAKGPPRALARPEAELVELLVVLISLG